MSKRKEQLQVNIIILVSLIFFTIFGIMTMLNAESTFEQWFAIIVTLIFTATFVYFVLKVFRKF